MKTYRAELYPRVLIRPVCGGCGTPMILGRSVGKYQSFCCHNANSGIKGCTNRGYKSARIIDEAVLRAVKAAIFAEGFVTDLTAEVNARLAEIARRPGVTRVREQDVVVALENLRELLEGNIVVAAHVLKALVGDVVIEARLVEGRRSPEMVATFTIDALRAFAALDRGKGVRADDPTVGLWEFLNADRWVIPARPGARDEPGRLYPPALNSAALGRRAGL